MRTRRVTTEYADVKRDTESPWQQKESALKVRFDCYKTALYCVHELTNMYKAKTQKW